MGVQMKAWKNILVIASLTFAVGNVALADGGPRLKGDAVSEQQRLADEAEWKASEDRTYKMRQAAAEHEKEKNAEMKKHLEQDIKDEKAGHKKGLTKEDKELGHRESRVISM